MIESKTHIEQLMLEKLAGLIGDEDNHYLDQLLYSDEDVRRQWEKVKKTFEESVPHRYFQNIDTNQAWTNVREGIEKKWHNKRSKMRWLGLAASFLGLLVMIGVFFYYTPASPKVARVEHSDNSVELYVTGSKAINLSQYNASSGKAALNNVNLNVNKGSLSYATLNDKVNHSLNTLKIPPTQTYKVILSDGTEVSLNSMSELKFPFVFSGDKREVFLDGEAYFKVAKDTHHPFIVHTPLTKIRVLGTKFNVNTYDSLQISASLVEGSVSTQGVGAASVTLKPGYEAIFSKTHGFDVKAFDSDAVLSWIDGIYYFQNASLKSIATVIHRWYDVNIVFDDAKSSSSRFTGAMFKDKPLREFLDNLALTSNINYYKEDNRIHISTH